nr:MAG TPA: hypothetical protein [Caudoviricetes sp.]
MLLLNSLLAYAVFEFLLYFRPYLPPILLSHYPESEI